MPLSLQGCPVLFVYLHLSQCCFWQVSREGRKVARQKQLTGHDWAQQQGGGVRGQQDLEGAYGEASAEVWPTPGLVFGKQQPFPLLEDKTGALGVVLRVPLPATCQRGAMVMGEVPLTHSQQYSQPACRRTCGALLSAPEAGWLQSCQREGLPPTPLLLQTLPLGLTRRQWQKAWKLCWLASSSSQLSCQQLVGLRTSGRPKSRDAQTPSALSALRKESLSAWSRQLLLL